MRDKTVKRIILSCCPIAHNESTSRQPSLTGDSEKEMVNQGGWSASTPV